MKRLALILVSGAAAVAAAPAPAGAASAGLLVVGREGETLRSLSSVTMTQRTVTVGKRRCAVGGSTALGLLAGSGLALGLRDYGSCGRDARDASGLYVRSVSGQKARGRSGWVYKIGRRAPSAGAAETSARVKPGARVLWFWCRSRSSGGCQRTLEAAPSTRSARAGQRIAVTVRGYDNHGRGRRVRGATVRLGSFKARTNRRGVARIRVPRGGGNLSATKRGAVRSFAVRISTR